VPFWIISSGVLCVNPSTHSLTEDFERANTDLSYRRLAPNNPDCQKILSPPRGTISLQTTARAFISPSNPSLIARNITIEPLVIVLNATPVDLFIGTVVSLATSPNPHPVWRPTSTLTAPSSSHITQNGLTKSLVRDARTARLAKSSVMRPVPLVAIASFARSAVSIPSYRPQPQLPARPRKPHHRLLDHLPWTEDSSISAHHRCLLLA